MCDLIDLNSPDVKGMLDPKLASPLIPVPKNLESKNESNLLVTEERESLGNNPFDMVLRKTTEYVSKKGDPFEVMLQRALRFKGRKGLKTQSVSNVSIGCTDDFTPKRKKYSKTLNKTSDESLTEDKLGLSTEEKIKPIIGLNKETINFNTNNTEISYNDIKKIPISKHTCEIFVTNHDMSDSSILNHSAMNDTLSEVLSKSKENNEIPIHQNEVLFKDVLSLPYVNLKPPDIRRSLSQGDKKSPKSLQSSHRRSHSVTDTSRKASHTDSTLSFFLDRGFLESKQSGQSVFSNLSNISSITRLNSISLLSSLSSSALSNNTLNNAFLNSDSSKIDKEKINTTTNSIEIKPMQYDLSDLAEKLNELKCAADKTTSVASITNDIESNDIIIENNNTKENKYVTNNKLIDVDVFVPELSFNKHNKSSNSTSSSDSVFTENNKVDKLIFNEAKVLAMTFEDLVLKTDSGSSIDDLTSNNTLWMSELLPAFEDDAVVDNLIELPFSPEKITENVNDNDKELTSVSIDRTEEDLLKEIKLQLIDCVPVEKQTIVTSLLLDLKKLIKAENNLEANKLLDNLENVLGTKCKTNTELLTTCLNITNEMQISERIDNNPNVSEKSEMIDTNINKENTKILFEEKIGASEKPLEINHELEEASQVITVNKENISNQISCCRNNLDTISTFKATLNSNYETAKKNNHLAEKLVIELLDNLKKFYVQAEDAVIFHLLKNIGYALKTDGYKTENEQHTNDNIHNIRKTAPIKITELEHNMHPSISTKQVNRQSFNLKSKSLEKKSRRSLSVINSPTKPILNTQISKHKDQPKDVKKRFSSDPGLINSMTNKKIVISETYNVKKETGEFDTKKEKPIAINNVKSKLKKKSNTVSKRGPIKAVHPVGNMQKKVSLVKQLETASSSQAITPPKPNLTTPSGNKIISSTPNSVDSNYIPKKAVKSIPIASSTPDGPNNKALNVQLLSTSGSKSRNFSCDISPVTTYINSNDGLKDSPKRSNKPPTPKKSTPKRHQGESGIPRYSTPPNIKKLNSSFDMNRHQFLPESPQYLNKSLTGYQRYSPNCSLRRSVEKAQQNPLKENNKLIVKAKPFNLISKLKRHSTSDFTEKENNYA